MRARCTESGSGAATRAASRLFPLLIAAATLGCAAVRAAAAPSADSQAAGPSEVAGRGAASTAPADLSASPADARLRTVLYSADEVYRLPGRVGYEIDVQFEPGELFVGVGVGDAAGLGFMAAANHLFIKPRAADVHTDLTVLTTRRIYHFDYDSVARTADDGVADIIYALRFLYPRILVPGAPTAATTTQRAPSVQSELARADSGRHRNSDYWYCGPRELQPLSAWDDGVQTHLHFAARAELPAVFVSEPDGGESLVNFHVAQDEIVVHRIARRFVLRRGRLVGCVVNRGFAGSGAALPTGTVSPDVERKVRGNADASLR
jgi:type IV secretion system protein VirB9